MKLTELVTTAKGRKATAKLAWDLGKIAGKVGIAGASGAAAALVEAAANTSFNAQDDEPLVSQPQGWTSEDPGGTPRAEDPEWN